MLTVAQGAHPELGEGRTQGEQAAAEDEGDSGDEVDRDQPTRQRLLHASRCRPPTLLWTTASASIGLLDALAALLKSEPADDDRRLTRNG